ncbi:MAG TPA: AI-2E family transporter, partial [Verrucomicrobiae bacterium]|nr:AI-2E family transporter [Verrucomicrobiae bacterium]
MTTLRVAGKERRFGLADEAKAKGSQPARREFTRRVWITVLIIAALGGGILLLWLAYKVALVFFAGVLLAIFLRSLADWVSRWTRLGPAWSLTIVLVGILAVCGGIGWVLAAPISKETEQLRQELPKAVDRLESQLEQYSLGKEIVARIRQPGGFISQTGKLLTKASDVFSITIEGAVYVWVILFVGFYLATQPKYYVEGFLKLMPPERRNRGRVILYEIGRGLRSWLFGQILSMSIIGFCTWLGLFLLH